ncbi:hypothetical protein M9Y10_042914 [Tritrichomonas musculus]|uniref:Protein kinase domain-containing protein n=1 Tax=Tritrichomonas musculus TaxID=1915356 RepID=A0ABR2JY78_9EUKA
MFYQQSHVPPVVVNNQEDGTQNVFVLNEELGHGSFATVYRVIHQKTSMTYAMKVLSKEQYSKSRKAAEKLKNEIEIQNTVDHPNIVGSKFSFSNQHNHYLILEYYRSCIVMDPNEQFVQIYKNQYSNVPEVVQLFETNGENELKNISLVKKMAKSFKKIRFSYDQPSDDYEPSTPLHFVRCFVKNDDCVLFKFNDKNLQVNFNDHMKLIIFWNTKKMCFFRSIKEKSVLLDLKSVASMNSNSEELKKFKNAKILLSNLALTIC